MAEAAAAEDATLTVVRGYYLCPIWGEQAHWWTVQISWTELLKENPNLPIWWDDFQKGLKNVFGFIEKMKESSRGRK